MFHEYVWIEKRRVYKASRQQIVVESGRSRGSVTIMIAVVVIAVVVVVVVVVVIVVL